MTAKLGIAIVAGACTVAFAGVASAQEAEEMAPSYMRAPVRAPRNAFELGVSGGYAQGFGNIRPNKPISSVAGGGGSVGLTLGYRSSPGVGIGVTGSYEQFRTAGGRRGTDVRGAAAGVDANFHLAPFERIDPVISVGTGYRLLWEAPPGANNNLLTHGFELARVNAGLDFRVSDSVAIGPSIGGGLDMFMWERPEGTVNRRIPDRRLNTFVFAGLQGRFDLGGQRQANVVAVGRR